MLKTTTNRSARLLGNARRLGFVVEPISKLSLFTFRIVMSTLPRLLSDFRKLSRIHTRSTLNDNFYFFIFEKLSCLLKKNFSMSLINRAFQVALPSKELTYTAEREFTSDSAGVEQSGRSPRSRSQLCSVTTGNFKEKGYKKRGAPLGHVGSNPTSGVPAFSWRNLMVLLLIMSGG